MARVIWNIQEAVAGLVHTASVDGGTIAVVRSGIDGRYRCRLASEEDLLRRVSDMADLQSAETRLAVAWQMRTTLKEAP